jgi:soluble lytic murein transglycosylase-like protein/TolA-binding protein
MHQFLTRSVVAGLALTIFVLGFAAGPSLAQPEGAPASAGGGDGQTTAAVLASAVSAIQESPDAALQALAALRVSAPHLDDVLNFYTAKAETVLSASGGERAFAKFLKAFPKSVLAEDAANELSELLKNRKGTDEIVALAGPWGLSARPSTSSAGICTAAGVLLAEAKRNQEALRYLHCARSHAPRSSVAKVARTTTDSIWKADPALGPEGAAAVWSEAKLRGREGDSVGQARFLDVFLELYPSDPLRTDAIMAKGKTFSSAEEGAAYLEKEARYASRTDAPNMLRAAAYRRWNGNDNEGALEGFYRFLANGVRGPNDGLAHYAIGRILEGNGETDAAIESYGLAANTFGFDGRGEAGWRKGWAAYRDRRYTDAQNYFSATATLALKNQSLGWRAESLYWQARTLQRQNNPKEADGLWDKVLAEYPEGYYTAAIDARRGTTPPVWAVKHISTKTPANLDEKTMRSYLRGRDLHDAGLGTLARRDLAVAANTLSAKQRRALLPNLEALGASGLAFREALAMSKARSLSSAELRPFLYPRAHRRIVETQARSHGIDPVVVWSLMRQESAFDANAVSPANAIGLMQLLPTTASRIASAANVADASREALFDPETNIKLGTTYLSGLMREFEGRLVLALAAYNAGETAARRWRNEGSGLSEDELIESITYRETRDYVKKILRNMRNYRRIWREP